MPNTRLILHVKGTTSETAEMPRDVVRAAISEGKITHSQLIWRPAENTWKPVREIPELLPIEHLILHVKGTESETTQLPRHAVKAAISEGKLSQSQLIWSPSENAWKQARELPGLLPSQKLAPASNSAASLASSKKIAPISNPVQPTPAAAVAPKVRVAAGTPVPQARPATGGVPQVRAVPTASAKPKVSASASQSTVRATTPILVRTTGDLVVKEDDGFHPFKWIFIGLGIIIALVLGANYFLVDQPLRSNLAETSFSNVTVHGHLGAFMQPNVLVIHIPSSSSLTADTLTNFFVALAHSTPQNPITRDAYDRIAVTSGWTAQYSFSGYSWKQLGDMDHDSDDQRKEFLMAQMSDASGQSLLPPSTLSDEIQKTKRDQVWNAFVANFTKP